SIFSSALRAAYITWGSFQERNSAELMARSSVVRRARHSSISSIIWRKAAACSNSSAVATAVDPPPETISPSATTLRGGHATFARVQGVDRSCQCGGQVVSRHPQFGAEGVHPQAVGVSGRPDPTHVAPQLCHPLLRPREDRQHGA